MPQSRLVTLAMEGRAGSAATPAVAILGNASDSMAGSSGTSRQSGAPPLFSVVVSRHESSAPAWQQARGSRSSPSHAAMQSEAHATNTTSMLSGRRTASALTAWTRPDSIKEDYTGDRTIRSIDVFTSRRSAATDEDGWHGPHGSIIGIYTGTMRGRPKGGEPAKAAAGRPNSSSAHVWGDRMSTHVSNRRQAMPR
jgi:hypothetical protein